MKRIAISLSVPTFCLVILCCHANAMEPFIGNCNGIEAHKYDIDNGRILSPRGLRIIGGMKIRLSGQAVNCYLTMEK